MKRQILSLLAGAAVLSLAIAPAMVNAEPGGDRQGPPKMERVFSQLNLTDAQKSQLEQIRDRTREQIGNILTPAQREVVQSALSNGQTPREAMRSANLSSEQREQIRSIHRASRDQMKNVLTEQQRQQLEQMRQSRRENREGRGNRFSR